MVFITCASVLWSLEWVAVGSGSERVDDLGARQAGFGQDVLSEVLAFFVLVEPTVAWIVAFSQVKEIAALRVRKVRPAFEM